MQQDFDFVFGRWHIHNRQHVDSTDPVRDEWVEFESSSRTRPIFGDLSHRVMHFSRSHGDG